MIGCTNSELQWGLLQLITSLSRIRCLILCTKKFFIRLSPLVYIGSLTLFVQIHEGVELFYFHQVAVVEILLIVRYHLLAIWLLFVHMRMRVNRVSQAHELYGMGIV